MSQQTPSPKAFQLTEDGWAVMIAFTLILLAAIGLLGPNGLSIPF